MKVAVKTLTGNKFEIEAELTTTIGECKKIVEAEKGFPAEGMKLICDGKVLKDGVTLEAAGVKPGSFLVCFVSKKAKAKKPAPAPAQQQVTMTGDGSGGSNTTETATTQGNTTGTTATVAPPASTTNTTTQNTPSNETANTTSSSDTTATTQNNTGATTTPQQPAVDAGVVQQVMEITNTDEATATAAVRAAFGDVSRAVSYVFDPSSMPQMPPPQQQQQQGSSTTGTGDGGNTEGGVGGLDQFRNDPRFDQLRTMVQQNPATLPAVLRGIETTNPQLFAIINQNPEAFVRMLNEPIQPRAGATASGTGQAQDSTQSQTQGQTSVPQGMGGLGAALGGLGQSGINPAQLVQMINAMPPQARAQVAQQLGITPDQLQQFQQMMSSMPPAQLQQLMQMGGQGQGGAQGQGGVPPGAVRVNLSAEDQAAIQRLESMGLGSRNEIIQVYLACDRNENQAANLLMDQAFQ